MVSIDSVSVWTVISLLFLSTSEAQFLEGNSTQLNYDSFRSQQPSQIWDEIMTKFQYHMINKVAAAKAGVGEEVTTCDDAMAMIFNASSTGHLWSLMIIDAWGKPGARVFKSKPAFYGDYDGCFSLTDLDGFPADNFTTQYCTSKASLNQIGQLKQKVKFTLGLCLPSVCSGGEVRTILNTFLKTVPDVSLSYGSISCQPLEMPLTEKAKTVIVVLSFFAAFIAIGTLYDVLIVRGYLKELMCQTGEYDDNSQHLDNHLGGSYQDSYKAGKGEYQELLGSKKKTAGHKPGWVGKFFLSFSVRSNGEKLLSTKVNPKAINCINGIRFYSMCWVVLGHTFGSANGGKTNRAEFQMEFSHYLSFQAITNALVSVDTFFTLSGFLMTYLVLKELEKVDTKSLPGFFGKFYFHRYWRLTPPYMLFMMTYVPLFKYIGDGPFWRTNGIERDECEETWWTNMLYINNIEHDDRMCMGISWYLANDMQFYVLSPLIFIPLHYFKARGLFAPILMLMINIITTGVLSKDYEWGPNSVSGGRDYHRKYYIKPYTRIGPYIIGMLAGWLLYRCKGKVKMNPFLALFGWIVATVVGFSVLYGLYDHTDGTPLTVDVAALYNALHRVAWGCVISWVIFACATGYGGPINTFLSWSWLQPLSRLTYCTYLVHMTVINYFFYIQREPFYVNLYNVIFVFLSILWMSFFVGFICSMAFESPFLGLEKIIMAGFGKIGKLMKKSNEKGSKPPEYVVTYSSKKT